MNHKTVEEYVLSMPNAVLEYPFGKDVAVYKVYPPLAPHIDELQGAGEQRSEAYSEYGERVAEPATSTGSVSSSAGKQDRAVRGEGKMFALIAEGSDPVRLSLKCDPQLAIILREKYETVMAGYHLNKKHWNTIVLTGQIEWPEIQGFIRHSYELVTD